MWRPAFAAAEDAFKVDLRPEPHPVRRCRLLIACQRIERLVPWCQRRMSGWVYKNTSAMIPHRLTAMRDRDGIALIDERGALSFGELDLRSNAVAMNGIGAVCVPGWRCGAGRQPPGTIRRSVRGGQVRCADHPARHRIWRCPYRG